MYRRRPKKIEKPVFPETLEGMGYKINDQRQLRDLEDDGLFVFEKKDRAYNEARYDALLNLIGDFIESALETELGLVKEIVPIGANPATDIFSKVYMTPGALETNGRLLVLLSNSSIRVGQWSKRVIIDESIDKGSVIETIKLARQIGFEHVFIFNPNENSWVKGKGTSNVPTTKYEPIPENETPENHCEYVFKNLLSKAQSNEICWITAGWGGHCVAILLNKDWLFFKNKVKAIAIANTVHTIDGIRDDRAKEWIKEHVTNWISSDAPLGEVIDDPRFGCTSFSAGVELPDHIVSNSLTEVMSWFSKVTEH